jgi:glycosyltransferase involved in cell wall biosynthesis
MDRESQLMQRVLILSPHFPPDGNAGAHRVRLLAPHLASYGWQPTIVAVDPRDYEGRLDPELSELVPKSLRVVRCRAWSAKWTRRLGIGDLGLRSLRGLYKTCRSLLASEKFDIVFITTLPSYPAMLGPILKKKFGARFVLDFQDPWVGAWGLTVGPSASGRPNLKSRLSRIAARALEMMTLGSADAITAVSPGTYHEIQQRNRAVAKTPCCAIPLGGEAADFVRLSESPRQNPYFDQADGRVHICYVGTLLPMGVGTLRALLRAAALLRERQPHLYDSVRLHFFGTSNQVSSAACERVAPLARELGVGEIVSECAQRISYLDALTVQTQASAILMMGSSERHYTASKLYPGLLAKRPVLAIYHADSSVVDVLRRAAQPPSVRLVTYDDASPAENHVEDIYRNLVDLIQNPDYVSSAVDMSIVSEYSAKALAGQLAEVFTELTNSSRPALVYSTDFAAT